MPKFFDKMVAIAVASLLVILTGCFPSENHPNSEQKEREVQMQVQKMSDINSGYQSSEADWAIFLNCWRDAVEDRLASQSQSASLPPDANHVVSVDDAAYHQHKALLDDLEKSIGRKLPKSYRDFAMVTGGQWLVESVGETPDINVPSHLSLIRSIRDFKSADPFHWGIWNEAASKTFELEISPTKYYRYGYFEKPGEGQDSAHYRVKEIGSLIKVGELEQGTVLLINPFEITSDGEWEAWMLSPQFPGAVRYRSFAELMQHIAYQDILESGGVFIAPAKLRATCARYLKTAATKG